MYHAIVRRRIANVFGALGRSDWDTALKDTAEDVHHAFPGDHPLGGERHTRAAVRLWFERLGRLFPGHDFQVHRVTASGWPWDTWATAAWTAQLTTTTGESYSNDGTHWFRIRWGKVTYFHAYLDTAKVEAACAAMAAAGVEEAAAEPVGD